MSTDERESLIERYVQGEDLTAQEEASVAQLLRTDQTFRSQVKAQMLLWEAAKTERRQKWQPAQPVAITKQLRPAPFGYWLAAASVVLALGVGLWVWNKSTAPTSMPLAVYEQFENAQGLATTTTPVDTTRIEIHDSAQLAYEFGDYDRLVIYTPNADQWTSQRWQVVRTSELGYVLMSDKSSKKYVLEQGRKQRLPLVAAP